MKGNFGGLKYYSYVVGNFDKAKDRILFDWKMPAVDVANAVMMFHISRNYSINHWQQRRRKKIEFPSPSDIRLFYQIIEYQRIYTPKRGYTVARYKELQRYNQHELQRYLK